MIRLLPILLLTGCATITDSVSTLQRAACAKREAVQAAIDVAQAAVNACPVVW